MYRGRVATVFFLNVFILVVSTSIVRAQTPAPATSATPTSSESDDANSSCPAPDKTHRYDAAKGRTWVVIEIVAGGSGGSYTVTNLYGKVCEDKKQSGNGLLAVGKCVAPDTCHATAYMDQDGNLRDIKPPDQKVEPGSGQSAGGTTPDTGEKLPTPTDPVPGKISSPQDSEAIKNAFSSHPSSPISNFTPVDPSKSQAILDTLSNGGDLNEIPASELPAFARPGGFSQWSHIVPDLSPSNNPFSDIQPEESRFDTNPGLNHTPVSPAYIHEGATTGFTNPQAAPSFGGDVGGTAAPAPAAIGPTADLGGQFTVGPSFLEAAPVSPLPQMPFASSPTFTPNFEAASGTWDLPKTWNPPIVIPDSPGFADITTAPVPEDAPSPRADDANTVAERQLEEFANLQEPTISPNPIVAAGEPQVAPAAESSRPSKNDAVAVSIGSAHDPGTPAVWRLGGNEHVDWTRPCTNVGCAVNIAGPDLLKELWPTQAQVIAQEQARNEYLANRESKDLVAVETPAPIEAVPEAPAVQETFSQTPACNNSDWGCWAKGVGGSFLSGSLFSMSAEAKTGTPKWDDSEVARELGKQQFNITAYYPCASASACPVQGGPLSSVAGPDGEARVRTLDDYRLGNSEYVTGASDKSRYGETYVIPEITYKSALDGQTYTLEDVPVAVHDTGGAFIGRPDKLDIATGIAQSEKDATALARSQPFLGEKYQTYVQYSTIPATSGSPESAPAPENPGSDVNVPLAGSAPDPRQQLSPDIVPSAQNPRIAESALAPAEGVRDINFAGLTPLRSVEIGEPLPDITPKYHELIPVASWVPDAALRSGEEVTADITNTNNREGEAAQLADRLAQADADAARIAQNRADQDRAFADRIAQAEAQSDAYVNKTLAEFPLSGAPVSGEEITARVNREIDAQYAVQEAAVPPMPTQKDVWADLLKTSGAETAPDTYAGYYDVAGIPKTPEPVSRETLDAVIAEARTNPVETPSLVPESSALPDKAPHLSDSEIAARIPAPDAAASQQDDFALNAIKKEQVAAQSAVDAAQKRLDAAKSDAEIAELKGERPCTDTGFIQCSTTTAARQLAVAQKNLDTVNTNYAQCASGSCSESLLAAKAQAEKGQGGTSAVFKAAEDSFSADMTKRIDALKAGSPLMAPVHAAYTLSDSIGYAATHYPRTLLEGTKVGEYLGFRGTPEEVIANAANPGREMEEKIVAARDTALFVVPVAADLSIGSRSINSLGGWTQGAGAVERTGAEVAAGSEVFESASSRAAANDNFPLINSQEGRLAVGSDVIPGESPASAPRGNTAQTRIDAGEPPRSANDNASIPPQTRESVILDNAPAVKIPEAEPVNVPGSEIGGQTRIAAGEQVQETSVRQRISDAWQSTKAYFGLGKAEAPIAVEPKGSADFVADSSGGVRIANDSIPRTGEILPPEPQAGAGAPVAEPITIEGTVSSSRITPGGSAPVARTSQNGSAPDLVATRAEPTGTNAPDIEVRTAEPTAPSSPVSTAERPAAPVPESVQPTLDSYVGQKWNDVKSWWSDRFGTKPVADADGQLSLPLDEPVQPVRTAPDAVPPQQFDLPLVQERQLELPLNAEPKQLGLALDEPIQPTKVAVEIPPTAPKQLELPLGESGGTQLNLPLAESSAVEQKSLYQMAKEKIFGKSESTAGAAENIVATPKTTETSGGSGGGAVPPTSGGTTGPVFSPTAARAGSAAEGSAPGGAGTSVYNGVKSVASFCVSGKFAFGACVVGGGLAYYNLPDSASLNPWSSDPAGAPSPTAGNTRTIQGASGAVPLPTPRPTAANADKIPAGGLQKLTVGDIQKALAGPPAPEVPVQPETGISGGSILSGLGSFLGGFLPSFLRGNASSGASGSNSAPPATPSATPTTPTTAPIKPSVAFISNPPSVRSGEAAQLSWTGIGSTNCSITTGDAAKTVVTSGSYQGSFTTKPLATTTLFNIECSGGVTPATGQVTVTVK